MKGLMFGAVVSGFLALVASRAFGDYTWATYGGHQYALTQDFGTWQECENEAVLAGGHLATINDGAENSFLTDLAKDTYNRNDSTWGSNLAWIGYYLQPGGQWGWISGEPVTYTNYYFGWSSYTGDHAYIHSLAISDSVGEWNHNPVHDVDYDRNPRGIIETSVPEPSIFVLLGVGAISLTAYGWWHRGCACRCPK